MISSHLPNWYLYRVSLLLECFCNNQRELNLENNLFEKSIYKKQMKLTFYTEGKTAEGFST